MPPASPRARRRGVVAVGEAVIDAALAGLVIGLGEALVLGERGAVTGAQAPALAIATVGLALALVLVVGPPLVLALRLAKRHPRVAAAAAALRAPGPPRVEALAALMVAVVALGALWWIGFAAAAYAFVSFKAHRPAAMLAASVMTAAALAMVVLAAVVSPPLGRWLGRRRALVRVTSGRLALGLGLGLGLGLALALDRTARALAPAWDPVPSYVRALALAAIVGAAVLRPARRLGRRGAALGGGAALALVVAAPCTIRDDAAARGVVVSRGVLTATALAALAAPFDDDGDGFADVLGLVDCDDGDPRVHPGAVELAGNGRDEDCVGGDADGARLATQRAARPSAAPGAARHDIVLVTVDSLRADHSSAYGYPQPTTPTLAALAARGVRFAHAVSTAPCTRFALPGVLFGRPAHTLPFGGGAWPLLGDHALPTLASSLAAAGYRSAAILSRDLPLSPPTYAGFGEVITVEQRRSERNVDNADAVAARALAWLRAPPTDAPRFLWVHFLDPHQPYEVPPGRARFPGAQGAYDAEIAFADAAAGQIFAAVDPARTIVVMSADHGEAFLDHQRRFHGSTLYEEELHVPLVIAGPGLTPRTVAATVSHLDLAPTLLDLVGVTTPAGMTGLSLRGALAGAPLAARVLVAAFRPSRLSPRSLVAAYAGHTKIIRDHDAWTVEVYDLAADPGERAPRRDGAEVRRMIEVLDAATAIELATLPPSR